MYWEKPAIVDRYAGDHRWPSLALDVKDNPYISFCVDQARRFDDPRIGHSRIGFMDIVSVAFRQGSTWHTKVLDWRVQPPPSPLMPHNFNSPSLAIDRHGKAHVSYVRKPIDSNRAELIYATFSIDDLQSLSGPLEPDPKLRDPKLWDPVQCDIKVVAENKPICCALTLDRSETPYIVWRTDNGALFCAHKSGWVPSIVHSASAKNFDAGQVDIALDTKDVIHISYFNRLEGSIGYAYSLDKGLSWPPNEILTDRNPWGQRGTSIACVDGVPSIAYGCIHSTSLECATREAGAWQAPQLFDKSAFGAPSLAVSAGPLLNITYSANLGIKYAYQEGDDWVYDLIDNAASPRSSLVINSSNLPCLAYEGPKFGLKIQNIKYMQAASW